MSQLRVCDVRGGLMLTTACGPSQLVRHHDRPHTCYANQVVATLTVKTAHVQLPCKGHICIKPFVMTSAATPEMRLEADTCLLWLQLVAMQWTI